MHRQNQTSGLQKLESYVPNKEIGSINTQTAHSDKPQVIQGFKKYTKSSVRVGGARLSGYDLLEFRLSN